MRRLQWTWCEGEIDFSANSDSGLAGSTPVPLSPDFSFGSCWCLEALSRVGKLFSVP